PHAVSCPNGPKTLKKIWSLRCRLETFCMTSKDKISSNTPCCWHLSRSPPPHCFWVPATASRESGALPTVNWLPRIPPRAKEDRGEKRATEIDCIVADCNVRHYAGSYAGRQYYKAGMDAWMGRYDAAVGLRT